MHEDAGGRGYSGYFVYFLFWSLRMLSIRYDKYAGLNVSYVRFMVDSRVMGLIMMF